MSPDGYLVMESEGLWRDMEEEPVSIATMHYCLLHQFLAFVSWELDILTDYALLVGQNQACVAVR